MQLVSKCSLANLSGPVEPVCITETWYAVWAFAKQHCLVLWSSHGYWFDSRFEIHLCNSGDHTEAGRQYWDQKFAYVHEQIQQTAKQYHEHSFEYDFLSKGKQTVFLCLVDHAIGLSSCLQSKSEQETHDPSGMLSVLEPWIWGVCPWAQQILPDPLCVMSAHNAVHKFTCKR